MGARLSFLGKRLPPAFELRVVAVAPGRTLVYEEAEWHDALVVVERGEIALESLGGRRTRFGCGDVLSLDGLSLRALHNAGGGHAVLVAVRRVRARTMCVVYRGCAEWYRA
jgi:hypothetical protein